MNKLIPKPNNIIINPNVIGIHIGANIHHQDHVIRDPNFNPINNNVSNPKNPILIVIINLPIFLHIIFVMVEPNNHFELIMVKVYHQK